MTDKTGDYRNGRHVVYNLNVHLVLVTKYRRGVITDRVREDIIQTTRETCERHDVLIEAIDGEDDHIHMLISYPPKLAVSNLIAAIKTTTSKAVRASNYPEVRKALDGGAFWSPSYFVSSTGGASLETVKQYVENQRNPNRKVGRPVAVSSPPQK